MNAALSSAHSNVDPASGELKLNVAAPVVSRSEGWPVSVVSGAVLVGPAHWENSEVLPSRSVAVAVTLSVAPMAVPVVNAKLVFPPASVVTSLEPRNVWPSPYPVVSHEGLEKNSSR